MERAMGLAEDIGKQKLDGRVLDTVKQFEQKLAGVQLSPMMQKILTAMKQNSMTVTMITGKNVNEVTLVCDVRLLPGFGQKYLEEVLKNLAEKLIVVATWNGKADNNKLIHIRSKLPTDLTYSLDNEQLTIIQKS